MRVWQPRGFSDVIGNELDGTPPIKMIELGCPRFATALSTLRDGKPFPGPATVVSLLLTSAKAVSRPRDATASRRATEGAGAECACGPLTHLETIRHLQTAPTLGLRPWSELKLRGCGVQKNEKVSKKELIKKLFKSLLTESLPQSDQ